MPTAHRLSFPTCLSHPRSIHLHCHTGQSIDCFTSLALGFSNRSDQNSQSSVAATGPLPGELTSTSTLSHLERVAHRPDNLLLQPQPPLSPGESVAHRPDNLLLQLRSSTRRTTTRLNKEQMTTTSHTQSRNYVATTTHSHDTHDTDNTQDTRASQKMRISPWVLTGFTGHTGRFFPLPVSGFLGDRGCTEVGDRDQRVQMENGKMAAQTTFTVHGYADTDAEAKNGFRRRMRRLHRKTSWFSGFRAA
jgi:hypothetical protein